MRNQWILGQDYGGRLICKCDLYVKICVVLYWWWSGKGWGKGQVLLFITTTCSSCAFIFRKTTNFQVFQIARGSLQHYYSNSYLHLVSGTCMNPGIWLNLVSFTTQCRLSWEKELPKLAILSKAVVTLSQMVKLKGVLGGGGRRVSFIH